RCHAFWSTGCPPLQSAASSDAIAQRLRLPCDGVHVALWGRSGQNCWHILTRSGWRNETSLLDTRGMSHPPPNGRPHLEKEPSLKVQLSFDDTHPVSRTAIPVDQNALSPS